jgi:hypothetical protein
MNSVLRFETQPDKPDRGRYTTHRCRVRFTTFQESAAWKKDSGLAYCEELVRNHFLDCPLREVELRRRAGQTPRSDDCRPRFPDHADLVEEVLDETISRSASDQSSELPGPPSEVKLPRTESSGKPAPAPAGPPAPGERIGRYLIERELGSGGFGQVLLTRDQEPERHVAICVRRHSV